MPNLFQQLLSGASNVAGRAVNGAMPAPANGLFSPEDIAAARKQGLLHLGLSLLGDTSGMGLGSALQQGVQAGQGAYGGALNDRMAQEAAAKAKQLETQRAAIMQKYTPAPGASPQDIMKTFPAMYSDLMQIGDNKGAENLRGIVEHMAQLQSDGSKKQAVQLGDRVVTFDPTSGKYFDANGKEVTDTTRHQTVDEIRDHDLARRLQEEQLAQARILREQAMGQQAQAAFANQNKDLRATEQLYGNWKGAYESAKAADPAVRQAAYKSAIVNFSRIADPGQRSSVGMLHYLETVQPSLVSRFHVTAEKLANGDFPPEVLDALNKHVDELHFGNGKNALGHVGEYEARRAGRVKAQPWMDQYLDKTEDVFPSVKFKDSPSSEGRVNRFFEGWDK